MELQYLGLSDSDHFGIYQMALMIHFLPETVTVFSLSLSFMFVIRRKKHRIITEA